MGSNEIKQDESFEQIIIWVNTNIVILCTTRISPDYAGVVYSVGIQQGGEKEWDFLWDKAKSTRVASETEVMMAALAHTNEPWLLWR